MGADIHSFGGVTLVCDDDEQFQAHARLGAISVDVLRLASLATGTAGASGAASTSVAAPAAPAPLS